MPEQLMPQFPEIITGPEDLPRDITFDQLVNRVGGKAAGLLWIQKYLPGIPQAKSITGTPNVSTQAIVEAAQAREIKLPWIIRPSTSVDNLPGAEGLLRGAIVRESKDIVDAVDFVRDPNRNFSGSLCMKFGLQPITVAVAEYSTSNLAGTMIGHPNIEKTCLADINNIRDPDNRDHMVFAINVTKTMELRRFTLGIPDYIRAEITNLFSVYQQITSLPEFSGQMTYQLELGFDPFMLYQIRDFLPKQRADFSLEGENFNENTETLVFGITQEQGIELQIYEYGKGGVVDLRQKTAVLISDDFSMKSEFSRDVNLFYSHIGLLDHLEVSRIRTTPLSIFSPGGYDLESGDRVNIISDGVNVKIEKL